MESLRVAAAGSIPHLVPCCRCGATERPWDRIAAKAYCPNCEEALVVGESEPLIERTHPNRCAVCNKPGTLCFHTFPLQTTNPVAMELCAEHLRGLLGRRLGPYAFNQLRRQLTNVGVGVEDLFLLHSAFYDLNGRALQPAVDIG
jgi:hypothetical protein